MSILSVMPSSRLIVCRPLLLLPSFQLINPSSRRKSPSQLILAKILREILMGLDEAKCLSLSQSVQPKGGTNVSIGQAGSEAHTWG